ncbi:ISLre2 family transposase [Streptococcus parauberis]|uniref:ISLre2 family transposase n=1 Tax=Streptococcus parauberis TaxID=1348 RepID=UPI000CCF8BF4|nr:ISLre2 family transposase [Streptococcus parauberis]MDT2749384.1 ISLre2 family transposase [Streptococcus parauberis]PNY22350.1 hypothetical protein ASN88_00593 [Streptococcus parauberis]
MKNLFDEKEFIRELDNKTKKEFMLQIKAYDDSVVSNMRTNGYKRVDESERTVVFTFGEITFSRNRWRKGTVTRYPVDEWLGLEKYMRYSPELIYHMAKHASVMSYRQVCQTINTAYRLEVTKDSVLKAVKIAGKYFSEKEKYRFYLEDNNIKKIKAKKIFIEGDGVMVKTYSGGDSKHNTDITHFLIHTGSKKLGKNRYCLENKYEIIHTNHEKAKEEVLDFLYNNFEITEDTILISNSDNGKGYTKRTFQEIKKALGIRYHEHFWDAYHLNDKINNFFKCYPEPLKELVYKSIQNHQKELLKTVLDTVESLINNDEEFEKFISFKQKLLKNFKDTKPPCLRGLSSRGIGVMESQHRKITYRMKHRGMYWSKEGVYAMAKMIVYEQLEGLIELFFGDWKRKFQRIKDSRLSGGHLVNHYTPTIKDGLSTSNDRFRILH